MTAKPSPSPAKPRRAPRPPRRLPPEARREQLVEAAMPVVAEQGLEGFSLDEIAERADVTRNLIYHYFPRGRRDIVLACGERAGEELVGGWLTDESIPLEQRMAQNFMHMVEQATAPTDAWRIHRRGRASDDPEYNAVLDRYEDVLVGTMAKNQLGTSNPPLAARIALKGFIAYTERVLDEMRATGAPREAVFAVIGQALAATVQAAGAAEGGAR